MKWVWGMSVMQQRLVFIDVGLSSVNDGFSYFAEKSQIFMFPDRNTINRDGDFTGNFNRSRNFYS